MPGLPEVDAVILVTWKASEWRAGNPPRAVRGVPLVPLDGWQEALGLGDPAVLSREEIRLLCRDLEPRTACGQPRWEPIRFAALVNLRLQTSPEERFHRMYLGIRARQRDQVVLHLYDLSASSERNPHGVAQREFEALHRLQQYPWVPRILDSFQDAPGYPGEMCFFTVVDPAAPCLEERAGTRSGT